eukprot:1747251-Rhodomonas_salina.1
MTLPSKCPAVSSQLPGMNSTCIGLCGEARSRRERVSPSVAPLSLRRTRDDFPIGWTTTVLRSSRR